MQYLGVQTVLLYFCRGHMLATRLHVSLNQPGEKRSSAGGPALSLGGIVAITVP